MVIKSNGKKHVLLECGHYAFVSTSGLTPLMCSVCEKEFEEDFDHFVTLYEEKAGREKVMRQIDEGGIRQIY